MNPNVDKARKVVHDAYDSGPPMHTDHLVAALDDAGLLVTPLQQRAICACKQYALEFSKFNVLLDLPTPRMLIDIGREVLAAEKRKETFGVYGTSRGGGPLLFYVERCSDGTKIGPLSEKEAHAAAKTLNDLYR